MQDQGKIHPKRFEGTILRIHIKPGIVSIWKTTQNSVCLTEPLKRACLNKGEKILLQTYQINLKNKHIEGPPVPK